MTNQQLYQSKLCTPADFLRAIRPDEVICVGGNHCEPVAFLRGLGDVAPGLKNVEIVTGKQPHYSYQTLPDLDGHLNTVGHFYDKGQREGQKLGNVTHLPSNLHDYMKVRMEHRPCTLFVAQVTPMDENGNFTLSGSNMWEKECMACADRIFLEVNPDVPKFHGCLTVNIQDVTMLTEVDTPVLYIPRSVPSETDKRIAAYVAEQIHDGDCIQLGIGGMPDTVANALFDKKDLGLHTEMFTSVAADLIEAGVITGARKNIDRGLHVGTFTLGDEKAYRIFENNPAVQFRTADYTNDPFIISRIDNMVSLNSCLELDLTGQICSESIGTTQWSGTAGAWDFAYGASQSKGGRGIIAISSTAKGGTVSRIRSILSPGAIVTIPRTVADMVITEYGVAYLKGRTVKERVNNLIAVAHPDFREDLRRQAREYLWI